MKNIKQKVKIQTLTPFKNGFTMVELIFVIILVGILAGIGTNFMLDNRLLNDTNFLVMKIKQKQRDAIEYDVNGFAKPWSKENSSTCIDFNTTILETEDSQAQKPHKFSSSINMDTNHTLCFDEYGRPYQAEHLLLKGLDINLSYNRQIRQLSVMPISGYVIIRK